MLGISKMVQLDTSSSDDGAVSFDVPDARHESHSEGSSNNGNIDGDSDNSDGGNGTPERNKKTSRHGKDSDPRLSWRDFGREQTGSAPNYGTMAATGQHPCDVALGRKLDNKDERSFQANVVEEKAREKDSSRDVQASISPARTAESGFGSNPNRTEDLDPAPFTVSLEEGWKGIMAASFGTPATFWSGTSAATTTDDDQSSQTTSDERNRSFLSLAKSSGGASTTFDDGRNQSFPSMARSSCEASSSSTTSGGEMMIRSFASDTAVLREDGNNHPLVYASLVMESMLGPETTDADAGGETHKEKEDLLPWTWANGDNHLRDIGSPPTEEIIFDTSWKDTEAGGDGDDDDEFASFPTPFDDVDPTPAWTPSGGDNDGKTPDGQSLSLMAASTYSRVFGLDYNGSGKNNNSLQREGKDKLCIGRPSRSEIPYGDRDNGNGDGTRSGNESDDDDDNVDTTAEATLHALAVPGGREGQSSSSSAAAAADTTRSTESGSVGVDVNVKCFTKWLWIANGLAIMGLFLVFVVVALYYAIEEIKA
jgi:hypothetical protein